MRNLWNWVRPKGEKMEKVGIIKPKIGLMSLTEPPRALSFALSKQCFCNTWYLWTGTKRRISAMHWFNCAKIGWGHSGSCFNFLRSPQGFPLGKIYCRKRLRWIEIDGSRLSFEENVDMARRVVELAHQKEITSVLPNLINLGVIGRNKCS